MNQCRSNLELVLSLQILLYFTIDSRPSNSVVHNLPIDIMHNDVTGLDAREECWS
jgi:hypothetical protein